MKKIIELLKDINKYDTAKQLIEQLEKNKEFKKESENSQERQGYIYERLWDIVIKFGLFKRNIVHFNNNVNIIDNIDNKFEESKKFIDDYLKKNIISGNSGGFSDITFKDKEYIYLSSVKYIDDTKRTIKDYSINNFCSIINDKNKDSKDKFKVILFVKNRTDFLKIIKNSKKSSDIIIKYIYKIYDLNDLEIYFKDLKLLLSEYNYLKESIDITNLISKYFEIDKELLKLRFHQKLFISESINRIKINNDDKKILIGALPRAGKSYIMGGIILEYIKNIKSEEIKNKENFNFLILTPAPNETISQYKDIFNRYYDFINNNIYVRTITESKNKFIENIETIKEEIKGKNNVFILSIQKANDKSLNKTKEKPDENHKEIAKSKSKYTDEYCLKWKKNKLINPITRRKIQEGKGVYNDFKKNCSHIKTPELKEDKSKSSSKSSSKSVEKENDELTFLNEIKKLIKPSIIFIDEAHFGMSSEKSKSIIKIIEGEEYDKIWKFLITATYNKPNESYKIKDENKLYFNINDIITLQRIANHSKYSNKERKEVFDNYIDKNLKIKFNPEIIDNIIKNDYNNYNDIINQYKNFPEPFLITTIWNKIDTIYKELELAKESDYNYNMNALFALNQAKDKKSISEFKNIQQLKELFYYFYGYYTEKDDKKRILYNQQDYYRKVGVIPRIKSICANNCRTQQQSNKNTQLWFLPYSSTNTIDKVCKALLLFLENYFNFFFKRTLFLVAISNNKETELVGNKYKNIKYNSNTNLLDVIKDLEKNELNNDKNEYDDLIILTAQRLKLGVSLPNTDMVVLFNSIQNADTLYQMMFRSMTELNEDYNCDNSYFCPKKKYGFIVDMNPQRTFTITDYIISSEFKNNEDKNLTNKRALITDIFNIDRDIFRIKYDDYNYIENEKYIKKVNEYTMELFDKISYDYNTNIKKIEDEIDDLNIEFDEKGLTELFKSLSDNFKIKNFKNNKRIVIKKEGVDEIDKKPKMKKNSKDSKNDEEPEEKIKKQEKEPEYKSNYEIAKELLVLYINIVSLLSSDSIIEKIEKINCILHKNPIDKQDKIYNFKTELLSILQDIFIIDDKDNEEEIIEKHEIKETFVNIFKQYSLNSFHYINKDNEIEIYNYIKELLKKIKTKAP